MARSKGLFCPDDGALFLRGACPRCGRRDTSSTAGPAEPPKPRPAPRGREGFVDALMAFVDAEFRHENAERNRVWGNPLEARVRTGHAVADVEVVSAGEDHATLRAPANTAAFRPGDLLTLSKGDPRSKDAVLLILEAERYANRGSSFSVAPADRSLRGLTPGPGWVLDRASMDLTARMRAALQALQTGEGEGGRVLAELRGEVTPRFDDARLGRGHALAAKAGLDDSQREAFARAYATDSTFLIQGPPGTGKTRVLASLAAAFARDGRRVLVTGFTHRAINHALRTIRHDIGFGAVLKVGPHHQAGDLTGRNGGVANFEDVDETAHKAAKGGLIVGATCHHAGARMATTQFDVVIFDEAGQLPIPVAVMGMLKARRRILIGDHRQMPPIIKATHAERWTTRSVFEHLMTRAPSEAWRMLTTTYRMNADINAFPSARFYEGRLKPAPSVAGRALALAGGRGAAATVLTRRQLALALGPEPASVWLDVLHEGATRESPAEAAVAADLVVEALQRGLDPHEVGVVAPFRAQCHTIARRVQTLADEAGVPGGGDVLVDTVERIQGQERDLVVLSFATSDARYASSARVAEFLFQPNRLNVALTRPRLKRIVLASPRLLDARPRDPEVQGWVEHLRALRAESARLEVAVP